MGSTSNSSSSSGSSSSSSRHQQQQQSKLDSIGLDFEQDKRGYKRGYERKDKRGYKRGYERISSRISEGTVRPPGTCYCDCFCVLFGAKLGGVLLFRLCLEKGVWLLVSCFRRWAAPATAAVAAAAAAAISSHQQQQQSKLDSIGWDFEQEKRGYKRGEDTRGFLVGFQKGRFGPREPVIAIDFASFSARN